LRSHCVGWGVQKELESEWEEATTTDGKPCVSTLS
jgi:hypothetical protein